MQPAVAEHTRAYSQCKPRVSHAGVRLTQTLEPSGMRPQRACQLQGTMPATPHPSYILVTPAAATVLEIKRGNGIQAAIHTR
jgi:hypothetical protein